jgi:hypothetical protein
MLEAPSPYHEGPVKHAMKDCNLMKRYLGGKNKPQDEANTGAAKNVEHDDFPKEDGVVMMIFGGTPTHPPRRKHKNILRRSTTLSRPWVVRDGRHIRPSGPPRPHSTTRGLPPCGGTTLRHQAGA